MSVLSPVAATHSTPLRRKSRRFFALFALISLSAMTFYPMASMAAERESTKKTATTIKLKVSATTVKPGNPLTMTGVLTPSKATGTVTAYGSFKSTGPWQAIKTVPVKNGVASGSEDIPKSFKGPLTIYLKAVYNGSATYASSSSNVIKVVIE